MRLSKLNLQNIINIRKIDFMRVVGLIPVRMESTRLPGKALKDILGLPAIVHVYKRCALAKSLDDLYVVTDSKEIKQQVQEHGGRVLISGKHKNGSERIHEVSKDLECSHIINIQGDEVLVDPKHIEQMKQEGLTPQEIAQKVKEMQLKQQVQANAEGTKTSEEEPSLQSLNGNGEVTLPPNPNPPIDPTQNMSEEEKFFHSLKTFNK